MGEPYSERPVSGEPEAGRRRWRREVGGGREGEPESWSFREGGRLGERKEGGRGELDGFRHHCLFLKKQFVERSFPVRTVD